MTNSPINLLRSLCAAAFLLGSTAHALPVIITDTTSTGATLDGSIGGGEYVGSNAGVNSGFGNVWGSSAALHLDSNASGDIQLGHAGSGFSGSNVAAIYLDTVGGGFGDTISMSDSGDFGRAAISGDGTGGGFSDLTFAAGFAADYAIAWDGVGNVNLFQLSSGAHTFITGLTGSGSVERGFNLSSIGLSAGDSFNYVVTYLNASNGFRSNEFMGDAFAGGNPGNGSVTLTTFSTFNSFDAAAVPEPNTIIPLAVAFIVLLKLRRK